MTHGEAQEDHILLDGSEIGESSKKQWRSNGGLMAKIECRGWKEICEFLNVHSKVTAKGILSRLNVLTYDGNKPVMNVLAYQKASLKRTVESLKK